MADLGNLFDSIFKNPFETLVHEGEEWLTDDAKNLIGQAAADITVAKAAVTTAATSQAAALQAVVAPAVAAAAEGIAAKVPVIGGLISGEVGSVATEGTDALINGIVAFLQGKLSVPAA